MKQGLITDQGVKAVRQVLVVVFNRFLDFVPRPKYIHERGIPPGFRVLLDFLDSPGVE